MVVDGEVIGYTKDAGAFTESLNRIEQEMQSETSIETAYVYNDIKIKRSVITNKPMLTESEFETALLNKDLQVGVHGVALKVDDQEVGNFTSEEQAQDTIALAVKKSGNVCENDRVVSYEIQSDITTEPKNFALSDLESPEGCSNYLATGSTNNDSISDQSASLQVASRGGVEVARDQNADNASQLSLIHI